MLWKITDIFLINLTNYSIVKVLLSPFLSPDASFTRELAKTFLPSNNWLDRLMKSSLRQTRSAKPPPSRIASGQACSDQSS